MVMKPLNFRAGRICPGFPAEAQRIDDIALFAGAIAWVVLIEGPLMSQRTVGSMRSPQKERLIDFVGICL